MAVLKDLIVHGSSRFLNNTYFNSISADSIGAELGVFKKIVATTGEIDSLSVQDLTANNATVLSLLDVRGELHTNQWTNSNIATIDGSFYITPTIGIPSGTMTTTANSLEINGTNFPISSLYVNAVNSDNTAATVAWTGESKVLVTGEILVNGIYMPLGTLVGVLDGDATASKIKVKNITDNRYQTAESLVEIGTQSTALPCRNVKVSMYQTYRDSALRPLGIFMTALGENGKTFLDIYGGGYATSTAVAGGFAKPVLRIGNLANLPLIGGETPTGYGIYTSNGYFSGTIAAATGNIAGWKIISNALQKLDSNNNWGTSGSAMLCTGSSTQKSIGGSASTTSGWVFTAGANFGVTDTGALYCNSANIKGALTATSLSTGTKTASTTGNGVFIDSSGNIYAGNGSTNNFTVTAAGAITAKSGTIAGWNIDSGGLRAYGDASGNSTSANALYYVYIASAPGTNGGNYAIGLRKRTAEQQQANSPAIGSADVQFGVSWSGTVYAKNADITGSIKATSGVIGNNATNKISISSNTTNAAIYSGSHSTLASTESGFYIGADGISIGSKFKYTGGNTNTLTVDTITATNFTMSSGTISNSVTIGDKAQSEYLNSNIEIGGRNYIRDSEDFNGWSCAPDSGGTAEINNGILHVITNGGYSRANGWFSIKYADLLDESTVFSVDIKANSTIAKSNIVIQLFMTNKEYHSVSTGNITEGKRYIYTTNWADSIDNVNSNTWTRVSWVVPNIKSLIDSYNSSTYEYFALYLGARSNAGGEIYFRKPKFEYGNKATDWTPAPEDIDVNKYITTISGTSGISVHNVDDENNFVNINSSGMSVYKGGKTDANKVAFFGSDVQIGATNSGYIKIAPTGTEIYGGDGTKRIAHIGYNTLVRDQFASNGSTNTFTLSATPIADGITIPSTVKVTRNGTTLTVTSGLPNAGTVFYYEYFTNTVAPNYIFGQMLQNNDTTSEGYIPGSYSFGSGYDIIASGDYSHAEGYGSKAFGNSSHAEGHSVAEGYGSHAEGHSEVYESALYAHAEGQSIASNNYAHSEGVNTEASGFASHSQNENTIAAKYSQTAIGTFNKEDESTSTTHPNENSNYGKYAFIIGNGTSKLNRSNALAVDWNGNAYCYPKRIELGRYISSGLLTSGGKLLLFSIPLGRVLPSNARISSVSFRICGRAASSTSLSNTSGGYYFIRGTSGGSDTALFNSTTSSNFYDPKNNLRTITSTQLLESISIQGGTNIVISISSSTDYFFTGDATVLGYINNQPVILDLQSIEINLSYN